MGANSKIEWTDHTFNPWVGCTKVSPACDNCYAEAYAKRTGQAHLWQGERRRTSEANWRQPLKWDREAAAAGRRARVFCASLADVFDQSIDPVWRSNLFDLIEDTPNLDWLLLTKRIGNVKRLCAGVSAWPNVWLGATVVNQEEADRDIPKLLATPARMRFLSIEPMLGPINLLRFFRGTAGAGGIDWVIVGGESGRCARPIPSAWVRSIRDQCFDSKVPFLFKQWGEYLPADADERDPSLPDVPASRLFWSDGSSYAPEDGQRGGVELVAKVGKVAAGREIDGLTHDGFPHLGDQRQ